VPNGDTYSQITTFLWYTLEDFLKWRYPYMDGFMENPIYKWMMTGVYPYDLGKLYLINQGWDCGHPKCGLSHSKTIPSITTNG